MSRTLAEKLAHVKPGTLFVGVDLGLDRNVAVVITDRAKPLARFSFPHDQDGYAYFRDRLGRLQQAQPTSEVLVGMEPTNHFWKLLATELEQHQISYRLVNAYTVKKHREGDQLDRSKDDVRDGFTIADLLRTGKYTKTRLLQGRYAELRNYATQCERLRREISRHKNLLWAAVGQLFPELSGVFNDLGSMTALAMIRNHAAASVIRTLPREVFIARVRADFEGQRLSVSKLRQAHALASRSVGVQQGVDALQLTVRFQVEALALLQSQWHQVRAAMADTFRAMPESSFMLSVPGLGLMSAATILAEIGDPSHYRRVGQWIKLAGTQPTPNTSGRKSYSQTPMSHKGRPGLRTALFFAVLHLVQESDTFAREYVRLQQRDKNPLTKMQALGVLMNKLLRILWALVRQKVIYHELAPSVA
jgi:transposase